MTYAIVINMDYESQPYAQCRELWEEIKNRMLEAGFLRDGRTFTTHLGEKAACELARSVIEGIEGHLEYHRKHVYRYLKDFYGYDVACTTNLLLPPAEDITVEEPIPPGLH